MLNSKMDESSKRREQESFLAKLTRQMAQKTQSCIPVDFILSFFALCGSFQPDEENMSAMGRAAAAARLFAMMSIVS